MKKNVVVVGSGIAGIVSAYYESKKGNNVTLIDSAEKPGGLLRSEFNGKTYFDYGTHILPETSIPDLNNFLFSDLNENNCVITKNIKASNYFNKRMNKKSCYVDASTLNEEDYNKGCIELLQAKDIESPDLDELLKNKVGVTFYEKIFKNVIKKYTSVDPQYLDPQVGCFFDMSRLLAFDDFTTKKLCEVDTYYSKLGHHTRVDGSTKYYPKSGGVGKIIEFLMNKLDKEGVSVKTSTNILSVNCNEGIIKTLTTTSGNLQHIDKLVWTLPSSYLVSLCKIKKDLETPTFINAGLYDFTFSRPIESEATFINVYEPGFYSGRITLYQNLSKTDNFSCTVEVLSDKNTDLKSLTDIILNELIKMNLVEKQNEVLYKQFRPIENGFPALTKSFVKQQNELNDFCLDYFNNVTFVGRSFSKDFFMTDVLVDVYNKIVEGV